MASVGARCLVSSVMYRLSNMFRDSVAVAPLLDWMIPSLGCSHTVISFVGLSYLVVTTDVVGWSYWDPVVV